MKIDGIIAGTAEIIALTATHGTFEYLLTFTFFYPAVTSSTRAPVYTMTLTEKTPLYNGMGEEIGYFNGQSYSIDKGKLNTIKVTIYKIRTENDIPVIYGSRVVSPDEYRLDPGLYYSGSWMQTGFTTLNLISVYDSKPSETYNLITGAEFGYYDCCVKFGDEIKSTSLIPGGASLSEFPYSMPDCRNSDVLSNSELCAIINRYNLQWFIPMYAYEDINGEKTVIGSAIAKKTKSLISVISSKNYTAIGGDDDIIFEEERREEEKNEMSIVERKKREKKKRERESVCV